MRLSARQIDNVPGASTLGRARIPVEMAGQERYSMVGLHKDCPTMVRGCTDREREQGAGRRCRGSRDSSQ